MLPETLSLHEDEADEPRFISGTILLERYRTVALIGRGAMGEIYRADDLKLHEPVALKFLPESLASDGAMLARLYREVRIAHQISHPNVCRVFDIGEAKGQHFISMEYIDGENLASLLRRIGHPPHAKALQIAQQLCLGLAAAHSRGVLHRDVKPANIMIDGRGQTKITDFGLAGLIEELGARETRAGTPAYMAPEQIHGLEVSIRSDIYSLGLVCYELFTGRRAFQQNQRGVLLRPSMVVDRIDPAVEKTLLQCLKMDPGERPASVREVAASLPGGDPLAAALAAGEIPSPEMVAAAPQEGSLKPTVAFTCLILLFFEIVTLVLISEKTLLYRRMPMEKPPEVLEERAHDLIRDLGLEEAYDEAIGFQTHPDMARRLQQDGSTDRWSLLETGRIPILSFWYRSSPAPLPAAAAGYWRVGVDDPPMELPGMTRVILDPLGRLIEFRRVLPRRESPREAGNATSEADWTVLFRAAGLDDQNFEPATSEWIPPVYGDSRIAWAESRPQDPAIPLRLEAVSYQGEAVFFRVVTPWTTPPPAWTRPVKMDSESPAVGLSPFHILLVAVIFTVLATGGVLAWRNLRRGRGDRQGAFRLALALFVISVIAWIFWASHVSSFAELMLFIQAMAMALFRSVFLWMVYLAMEPFVRENWPERIISWSRFLAGRWRDPLVGRDLLVGALLGLGMWVIQVLGSWAPTLLGGAMEPLDIDALDTDVLMGLSGVLRQFHEHLFFGPLIGLTFLFVLLLLTLILGHERWATAAGWLLLTCTLNLAFSGGLATQVALAISAALLIFVLQRFGLFAVAAATVFYMTFRFFPITADTSSWFFDITILALLIVIVPAVYGFSLTLAGQEILHPNLLEDRISSGTGG